MPSKNLIIFTERLAHPFGLACRHNLLILFPDDTSIDENIERIINPPLHILQLPILSQSLMLPAFPRSSSQPIARPSDSPRFHRPPPCKSSMCGYSRSS